MSRYLKYYDHEFEYQAEQVLPHVAYCKDTGKLYYNDSAKYFSFQILLTKSPGNIIVHHESGEIEVVQAEAGKLKEYRTEDIVSLVEFPQTEEVEKLVLSGTARSVLFPKKAVTIDISQFSTSLMTSLRGFLKGCSKIREIDLTGLNLDQVVSVSELLKDCRALGGMIDIGTWNSWKVKDFSEAFKSTSLGTINADHLVTKSATNLSGMFSWNPVLSTIAGLETWNTSRVTDMSEVFCSCPRLGNPEVSGWNTESCTTMKSMFANLVGNPNNTMTDLNLSGWKTDKCTSFSGMFQNNKALTSVGDLSKWNTRNCQDFSYMFCGTDSLRSAGDIGKWDIRNARDLSGMFEDCGIVGLDLFAGGHDPEELEEIRGIFKNTRLHSIGRMPGWSMINLKDSSWAFSGVLGLDYLSFSWIPSGLTKVDHMFYKSGLVSVSFYNTDFSSVTDIDDMFSESPKLRSVSLGPGFDPINAASGHMFRGCNDLMQVSASNERGIEFLKNQLVYDQVAEHCMISGGSSTWRYEWGGWVQL